MLGNLANTGIRSSKPRAKPYKLADGGGIQHPVGYGHGALRFWACAASAGASHAQARGAAPR